MEREVEYPKDRSGIDCPYCGGENTVDADCDEFDEEQIEHKVCADCDRYFKVHYAVVKMHIELDDGKESDGKFTNGNLFLAQASKAIAKDLVFGNQGDFINGKWLEPPAECGL